MCIRDRQHPVQVVEFVADAAGEEVLPLLFQHLAGAVLVADLHLVGAGDKAELPREGEAALHRLLLPLAGEDLGVDQLHRPLPNVDDNHPAQKPHLGGGQADPVGLVHGLDHVLHQLGQFLVKLLHRAALLSQELLLLGHDVAHCHGLPAPCLLYTSRCV